MKKIKKSLWIKLSVVVVVILIFVVFFKMGGNEFFELERLKEQREILQKNIAQQPWLYGGGYFLIYIFVTALSLPGAAVMTLAGGALFGFLQGLILVSFASTIGASLAFLASRWILGEWVQRRYRERLRKINEGIRRDGILYLVSLRMVPVFPFFVINLLMGLTLMPVITFFVVSQLAMLPGTAAYIFAGTQLAEVEEVGDVLSPTLLLAFLLMALLPIAFKFLVPIFVGKWKLRKFPKPKAYDYNVVVIGGGSAGLLSAYLSTSLKAKAALVEKHKMGGDCLNTGCVPSKALIRVASIVDLGRRASEFGLNKVSIDFDFSKIMDRVQKVIKQIEPHDSVERYQSLGVDCYEAEAKILSPYEVQVGDKILKTRGIVVATGARPFVPPIKGLDQVKALTSDNLWGLKVLPKRLVVLGGGPIGSELAQCFVRLGSEVTMVEMGPRIMPREDEDVSTYMTKEFVVQGMSILTRHRAEEVVQKNGKKILICQKEDSEKVEVEFDEILVAVGRKANIQGFGLEELKVKTTKQGTLEVDEFLRTSVPNITACGDVVGPYQFTHAAAHQAYFAIVNNLFFPINRIDYRVMPWCTFTDPEVARVGLNEQEAKAQDVDYEVAQYSIDDLDRAIADGEANGFLKVLTVPGKDQILGVTIVGPHVGNILAEMVLAMKHNIGLNKLLSTIHVYPTLAEANRFVAGVWKKQHKPDWALNLLSHYFSRSRGG